MWAFTLTAEILTAFWLFVMGACFGSFLNVVIYRVPRGLTLFGNSCCPHCGQAILFRDNIPVISWLGLRGRCRHCEQPIAARYWQIELAVALIWLVCGVVEIALGGINLPMTTRTYRGFAFNLTWHNRDVILMTLLHIALLMQLLVWAMMEEDGSRLPKWWSLGYLCLVMSVVWVCPGVHPACVWFPASQRPQALHLAIELAAAACTGMCMSTLQFGRRPHKSSLTYAVMSWMAIVGSLGLAALPSTALICVVVRRGFKIGAVAVWMSAVPQILFWRPLQFAQVYLGFGRSAPGLILAALAVFVVGILMVPTPERNVMGPPTEGG